MWAVERRIGGVDASRDELLPYVGPAAALPLYGALARVPHPVAVRIWSGLLAAACAGLMLGALALARERRASAPIAALLLAIASGPMTSALALGQVALLSAAGIVGALLAYDRRAVAAGAFATLLAGFQPNLALALLARMRDRTAVLSAALGGIAFAVLTLAAGGGVHGFVAYLHRLGEHGRAERYVTIQHTPAAIAYAFGASDASAAAAGTIVAVVAVVAVVAAIVRFRLDTLDGTLLAIAALPLAVPFFHEHDFVLLLLPLTILAVRANGAPRAWAGVAAVLVLVDWLGLAQRPPGAAQIVAQGVALAFAFVAIGPGTFARRSDLAAFAALIVVACAAVPIARAHPAPTWPDGLPVGYRAPAAADASAVWADEQRAAGLDERQPAWGALRALPLAGCIVLGIGITLGARGRLGRGPYATDRR